MATKMGQQVKVFDNGTFMVTVDGLIVSGHNTIGGAWSHIAWMHRVASQDFVVGDKRVPVEDWIAAGIANGFLDADVGVKG